MSPQVCRGQCQANNVTETSEQALAQGATEVAAKLAQAAAEQARAQAGIEHEQARVQHLYSGCRVMFNF